MKNRFEGYYFKLQKDGQAMAVIPGCSEEGAFIQIITREKSYNVKYDRNEYYHDGIIQIGNNKFSKHGMVLNIKQDDIILTGKLRFDELKPLKKDIMGPFQYFPMECRHMIVSMAHTISGRLTLNGSVIDFNGGTGYLEGDRGKSFPEGYSWSQCNIWEEAEECQIVAAAAKIPFMKMGFWGCFALIHHQGREYKIATYKGGKIACRNENMLVLTQGKMRLTITVPEHKGNMLYAPYAGKMNRTIEESVAVRAHFRFEVADQVIFDRWTDMAGYEFAE